MAYNSINKSRFYIDNITWLRSLGIGSVGGGDPDIFGFNVANPSVLQIANPPDSPVPALHINYDYETDLIPMSYNFCAILGHNFKTTDAEWGSLAFYTRVDGGTSEVISDLTGSSHTEIANQNFEYDGYSIIEFADTLSAPHNSVFFGVYTYSGNPITIGRFLAGKIYEMPHSADLSLSLEYSTGTKTIETKGGASLSNTIWRPPLWGDLAAWELNDPANPTLGQTLAHSSRRIWNLKFSFISKENMFAKYDALNTLAEDPNATDPDQYTLTGSDDFFSRVWNVVGNHSKFIFQPDKDVADFAIEKFDMRGIKFTQVAHTIWSFSVKIREVW